MVAYLNNLSNLKYYEPKMQEITEIRANFTGNLKSISDPATILHKFMTNGALLERLTIENAPRLTIIQVLN